MAGLQVHAVYAFDAQPGSGEISLQEGDVLTVTRQDVGEGWWEGCNQRGEQGLFPEAYVQPIDNAPPDMPPPPLPEGFIPGDGSPSQAWGEPAGPQPSASEPPPYTNGMPPHQPTQMTGSGTGDDGWGSKHSSTGGGPPLTTQPSTGTADFNNDFNEDWSDDDSQDTVPARSNAGTLPRGDYTSGKSTVRKNINRFTNFVKSGTEAYVLGSLKPSHPVTERMEVVMGKEGPMWSPNSQPYTCLLQSPTKASKLKGLKSFIAYQLTPSFNGIQVSRRYKHFDWLHQRLVEKYSLLPIPPLPEKQVAGRYEEEFIEHRMALLQLWVNKLCRHPVLSQSQVWHHFITCTDEKQWKQGKRKAEKNELIGGSLFLTISVPPESLDPAMVEAKVESFLRFARTMDESVKSVYNMCSEYAKKMQGPLKKEYQKIGIAFRNLGLSYEQDSSSIPGSDVLGNSMKITGDSYDAIALMTETQPKIDLDPLMDTLYAYKGMLSEIPDMVNVHRSALGKLSEHSKMFEDGKISQSEFEAIRHRVDVISYAMLAEMNQFQNGRVADFKEAMSSFLKRQIDYYDEIGNKLKEAFQCFESL